MHVHAFAAWLVVLAAWADALTYPYVLFVTQAEFAWANASSSTDADAACYAEEPHPPCEPATSIALMLSDYRGATTCTVYEGENVTAYPSLLPVSANLYALLNGQDFTRQGSVLGLDGTVWIDSPCHALDLSAATSLAVHQLANCATDLHAFLCLCIAAPSTLTWTLPTTLAPTTKQPTATPTTLAPTTKAPTTLAPTTLAPTTLTPTTLAPSPAPTTLNPTTLAPTTIAPTLGGAVSVTNFDDSKANIIAPSVVGGALFVILLVVAGAGLMWRNRERVKRKRASMYSAVQSDIPDDIEPVVISKRTNQFAWTRFGHDNSAHVRNRNASPITGFVDFNGDV